MPILLGGATLGEAASVWADAPSTPASKQPELPAADPATQASFATFLKDYHRALTAGDEKYLGEHTVFPLSVAELVYDMEVKTRRHKLGSATSLKRAKQRVLWPSELVPSGPESLMKLRRGTVNCADSDSPDKPDYKTGELAIQIKGDEATLTYMVVACDSEAHVAILTFLRSGDSWRLRDRAVRRGAR